VNVQWAYAFAAGMVATVNPCGFAMLPAYLTSFLSAGGDDETSERTLRRALVVGAAVSIGFLVVFGALGLLFGALNSGIADVQRWLRWVTLLIGVALVAGGIATLAGRPPKILIPKLERGGKDGSFRSMFLFGVSYAIASISCAFGVFSAAIIGAFDRTDALSAVVQFLVYGMGMAVVLVSLTITMALTKQGLLKVLRRAMRYVDTIAGVFMIASGLFLVVEAVTQLRRTSNAAVDGVGGWANQLQGLITDIGTTRIGIALACVIAAAAFWVTRARRRVTSDA
jgi:cytochrome c-type biogenesis protein